MLVFVMITVFFQAEDAIRDGQVTGVQTCAPPIWLKRGPVYQLAARWRSRKPAMTAMTSAINPIQGGDISGTSAGAAWAARHAPGGAMASDSTPTMVSATCSARPVSVSMRKIWLGRRFDEGGTLLRSVMAHRTSFSSAARPAWL